MHSTFSIIARDPDTGLLGIAIATMVPAAGSLCPHIRHGVGAVCTQGWTNPYLGPKILDRMAHGRGAPDAMHEILETDPEKAFRQVLALDASGHAAQHTGAEANAWAGGKTAANLAIAGNFLVGAQTVAALEDAYNAAESIPGSDGDIYEASVRLGDRLIAALNAGEATGGDWRGNKSAAVMVGGPDIYPLVDLRVDHHDRPVAELRRIFEVSREVWFPFVKAVPTRSDPRGAWAAVREKLQKKAGSEN